MNKITIINGMVDDSYQTFEDGLSRVFEKCKDRIESENFKIRKMNIQFCCGCFGCWVKTPGRCVQDDEMPVILRSIINSDLVIFVSPVRMGFVTANLKKVNDKMIPLVHPYIRIFNGECHHVKRYYKYPKLGLILIGEENANSASYRIITDIYQRMAINLKTKFAFSILSHGNMEEIENAINHF